jgi:hypothetical protein
MTWKWWMAVPIVGFALVWPLQAILIALLLATVLVGAGAYSLWVARHPMPPVRRVEADRIAAGTAIGAVVLGGILTFVWPMTMAIAVLLSVVVACAAWCALDWAARHARPSPLDAPAVQAPPDAAVAASSAPAPATELRARPPGEGVRRRPATPKQAYAPGSRRPGRARRAPAANGGTRRRSRV